jgi:prepilin-type processing-associated H-X9-DG protein
MEDATISTRPIISGWLSGFKDPSGDSFTTANGGHSFAGKVRSANCAYADSHVETHSGTSIKWELEPTAINAYIFY